MENVINFALGMAGGLCAIVIYRIGFNSGRVFYNMRKRDEGYMGGLEKGERQTPMMPTVKDDFRAKVLRNTNK